MATVTSTIGTGLDYATIGLWEADTDLNAGADIWKGECADEDFDESVTFDVDGTSVNSYVWLEAPSANRHVGPWNNSKARMVYTGGNTAAVQVDGDWFRIGYMQIARTNGAGGSDEAIRMNGANVLIEKCLLISQVTDALADMDAVYIGTTGGKSVAIDNCVMALWSRAGPHNQVTSAAGADDDSDWDLDFNTVVLCGTSGLNNTEEAPLAVRQEAGGTTTVNAYNNVFKGQESGGGARDILVDTASGSTVVFNGSHNAWQQLNEIGTGTLTENWTDRVAVTATAPGVVTTDTANSVILTNLAATTFDATPQDLANNVLRNAGTAPRTPADPRQDLTVDITGNPRGTTDITVGAFQIPGGADTIDIGTASETDTAGTVTPDAGAVTIDIGTAAETDTALNLTVSTSATVALGTVAETDTAGTLTPSPGSVAVDIGTAAETDTAGTITPSAGAQTVDIGTAAETDTAGTLTPAPGSAQVATGTATEADTAGTLTIAAGAASVALATGSETDTAGTITPTTGAEIVDIGTASESDTAGTLTPGPGAATINIGTAAEADTAGTIVPSSGGEILIDPGTENDTAGTITPAAGAVTIDIGTATETDTAGTISPTTGADIIDIGTASETDTAGTVTAAPGAATVALGTATETDTAGTLTPSSGAEVINIGTAGETDSAGTIGVAGAASVDIGTATETDTANELTVIGPHFIDIGTASEIDAAGAVALVAQAVVVGSWYQLLAIIKEAREVAEVEAATPPVDCPVCGDQLRTGPQGGLYCPFNMSHPVGYGWGVTLF